MQIAKRERFQDIRQIWKNDTDFSDWLVTEDGIKFLAKELGGKIENASRSRATFRVML